MVWLLCCRGDTPFCSEECRQEEIDNDEAKEKKLNLSASKALREKDHTTSPKNYHFPRGTIAAAWVKKQQHILYILLKSSLKKMRWTSKRVF